MAEGSSDSRAGDADVPSAALREVTPDTPKKRKIERKQKQAAKMEDKLGGPRPKYETKAVERSGDVYLRLHPTLSSYKTLALMSSVSSQTGGGKLAHHVRTPQNSISHLVQPLLRCDKSARPPARPPARPSPW